MEFFAGYSFNYSLFESNHELSHSCVMQISPFVILLSQYAGFAW